MSTLEAGTEPAFTTDKGLWPEEFRPTVHIPTTSPSPPSLLHISSTEINFSYQNFLRRPPVIKMGSLAAPPTFPLLTTIPADDDGLAKLAPFVRIFGLQSPGMSREVLATGLVPKLDVAC